MNIDRFPTPLFIAHRGYSSRYPENTLAAFNAAIDAGARMIELDVNLSRDRQMVVIHDETVDRTTSGTGRVAEHTLSQLSRLDAGSWFDPQFCRETLPTLAQVLDAVKGQVMVNIEIKPEAYESHGPPDAVERQVLDLVCKKQMLDDVLVSSFEWQVLDNLRTLAPGIALGLLSDLPVDRSLLYWYQRIRGFSWHPDYRVLTRPQVDALHDVGARVFPYAVDGRMDTGGMLAMGVDGLIVDDPRQMTA
ncbi:glycerophosphodiester phosphodiesterase [Desulfosarcina alkanivorans]|jgi:glycerophosphoryl diester phosphodiesterase|uniref:Glycerophosphodiester phosphodiesterase n=1 Tax=Desulfosarcina alkanivorans TaxID=571177 RepID=A0A5K7YUZ7_9BACT|nr:glycerophosphodiester phosphodiesterase family protein [Desulfosarcina alkanivorans]BBO70134.1 glycerophosphodiester phosphodiesterase [Desulfosarcina alkanivorans]